MDLADFTAIAQCFRASGEGFNGFRLAGQVLGLGWPDDVAEQWLHDHSENKLFLQDYGGVELSRIHWGLEALHAADIATLPTGPSEREVIDQFATNPDHWISVRDRGVHLGVSQMWEIHGTWKRWPVLIDRVLLKPPGLGLQVIEGRTRVGILKGRLTQGSLVADRHLAWVGRPRP